ncbi:hypothetical protein BDV96DRAFT_633823 [Lophiotrema nucula]|uniref:Uncharacterized protein n=1 Tax=Lophiotrema nucula TaxID=690887 RepID=A0A6A5Z2C5_9PLEO|nr:hypothetical protein BDV96DRAFT_633823 [Lophiotrema nucula]
MNSPTDSRKRPPPIHVPPPPPPRQIPGENAFAKAKRDELEKQREGRSAINTPVTSPLDGPQLLTRDDRPRKDTSERGTFMTTMTNLMDLATSPRKSDRSPRKSDSTSPRKSDSHSARKSDNNSLVSSTTSRHGSTIRSRHSQKSQRSEKRTYPIDDNSTKSVRGVLESQTEKKRSYQMEAPEPSAPAKQEVHYTSYDLTDQCKEVEAAMKSPKKKIFGMSIPAMNISSMSIPSFKTVQPSRPPPAVPHMPSKAAKVLGESPASKRHDGPHPSRFAAPRSDTSKSLPSKLYYDQHSHNRRGNHQGSTRGQRRNVSHKTSSPPRPVASSKPANEAPTPPQKDTPPENKNKHQSGGDHQIQEAYELEANGANVEDGGVLLPLPSFATNTKPIPANGGMSPTKYRPYGAEEYAALIEGQPIASAHVQFGNEDVQNGGKLSAPLERENRVSLMHREERGRWSEENWNEFSKRTSKHLSTSLGGELLPPAFYSPEGFNRSLWVATGGRPSKNTDQARYLFAVPPEPKTLFAINNPDRASIPIHFQRESNDLSATSHLGAFVHEAVKRTTPSPQKGLNRTGAMMTVQEDQSVDEQQTMKQPDVNRNPTADAQKLQPEQSSSKLTDMLGGVSPSKGDYNHDFYANCPSALPSPLYGVPGQPMPGHGPPIGARRPISPPQSIPGAFPDGSNVLWHFMKVNEHMDVLGQIVYDSVQNFNNEQTKIIISKQIEQINLLKERFEALKADVNSIEGKMENAHEQSQTINSKLDHLLEFIKTDVVQPAAAQSLRMVEMSKDIKELQKVVHGLQGGVESRSTSAQGPIHVTQGPVHAHVPYGGLPNHRSQPSLINHYNPAHDAAHDPSRMPPPAHPLQERYRANNPNNWYRPNFGSHNTTRDEDQNSISTNPYVNNAAGFGGSYGYGNYHYGGNPSEQPFNNYGPGGPK